MKKVLKIAGISILADDARAYIVEDGLSIYYEIIVTKLENTEYYQKQN